MQSITVQYGARADEQAFALSTAEHRGICGGHDQRQQSKCQRAGAPRSASVLRANLAPQAGQQSIQDMQAEFAGAQTAIKATTDRQTQLKAMAQTMLDSIEGVSTGRGGDQDPGAADHVAGFLSNHRRCCYQTTLSKYLPA